MDGEEAEDVEKFPYLGDIVDKERSCSKDLEKRLQKDRNAF